MTRYIVGMKKSDADKLGKRKSSAAVTLVVIGAAMTTLGGCAKEDVRRDVYANKQDCLADWGNNPADCEPAYDHPASRGAAMAFYGRPYIRNSGAASASRSSKSIGSSSSVSRGGFGLSGRSASSGG